MERVVRRTTCRIDRTLGFVVLMGALLVHVGHVPGQEGAAPIEASDAAGGRTQVDANLKAVEPADSGLVDRSGRRSDSLLGWMARASGLIGLVILGMSFYLVALVIWMSLRFRRSAAMPEELIQDVIGLLSRKQYDRAYSRLANDPSFLAKTLTPAVRRLPSGPAAAQKALELANEDVTMEMDHQTTYLATVGTLGPMIGLVGTVYGMIRSFQAIATQGATPDAAQLAAGISTALFVTLEGIALAVPAIAFHAFFRNRIARLSLEVQMTAEALLEQFAPGVRAPHPLAASIAQPTSTTPGSAVTIRTGLPPKDES